VLADVLSQDATILQVHIVHSLGQLYHDTLWNTKNNNVMWTVRYNAHYCYKKKAWALGSEFMLYAHPECRPTTFLTTNFHPWSTARTSFHRGSENQSVQHKDNWIKFIQVIGSHKSVWWHHCYCGMMIMSSCALGTTACKWLVLHALAVAASIPLVVSLHHSAIVLTACQF